MDYNHEGHACKINTWQKKLAVTVIAVGTGVILYFIIQAAMADTTDVQRRAERSHVATRTRPGEGVR